MALFLPVRVPRTRVLARMELRPENGGAHDGSEAKDEVEGGEVGVLCHEQERRARAAPGKRREGGVRRSMKSVGVPPEKRVVGVRVRREREREWCPREREKIFWPWGPYRRKRARLGERRLWRSELRSAGPSRRAAGRRRPPPSPALSLSPSSLWATRCRRARRRRQCMTRRPGPVRHAAPNA
eukprot:scaffold131516_cov49-Tisochrysis_lutea.AAC.1